MQTQDNLHDEGLNRLVRRKLKNRTAPFLALINQDTAVLSCF